jgi:hypothetical protein
MSQKRIRYKTDGLRKRVERGPELEKPEKIKT